MSDEERCPDCGGYRALPRILHDREDPYECVNPFHQTPAPVLEFPSPEPPSGGATTPGHEVSVRSKDGTEAIRPKCPHCGCEGKIRGSLTTLGPLKVFAVYCGNDDCRGYLGFFQPLGLEKIEVPSGAPN